VIFDHEPLLSGFVYSCLLVVKGLVGYSSHCNAFSSITPVVAKFSRNEFLALLLAVVGWLFGERVRHSIDHT